MNKPIIMTAQMGDADFSWANSLRREYFPPDRNVIPAHITLFHHLPPGSLPEIKSALVALMREYGQPPATLQRVMNLGTGVAYQIYSPELLAIRMNLADMFHGLLTAQDQQEPRLHFTIQNKVSATESKALFQLLSAEFQPRPFQIKGIALQYYMDGPWEPIGSWSFRGAAT